MVNGGDDRLMVKCVDCGSVFAARERSKGELQPIGAPSGCDCGSTEFVKLDGEHVLEFDDETENDPDVDTEADPAVDTSTKAETSSANKTSGDPSDDRR